MKHIHLKTSTYFIIVITLSFIILLNSTFLLIRCIYVLFITFQRSVEVEKEESSAEDDVADELKNLTGKPRV